MSIDEVRKEMNKLVREWKKNPLSMEDFRQADFKIFVADQGYVRNPWTKYYPIRKSALGKIIIEGTGDNSIPYELFEQIEELFSATRCHLG